MKSSNATLIDVLLLEDPLMDCIIFEYVIIFGWVQPLYLTYWCILQS
jgi:hypothetical protein